jgi:hypothetical protein
MRLVCVFGLLLGWAVGARAQTAVPATTNAVLADMGSRAAVIFAGTVESVSRMDALGYVDVRFRVDDALKGCRKGAYVLREWAGLWRDAPRYVAGQRRLLLLLARGPGGMSSPVDGMAGAIPLTGASDAAVMKGGVAPVDRAGGANANVDLRWIQMRALRGPAAAIPLRVHAEGLTAAGAANGWVGVSPVLPMNAVSYQAAIGMLLGGGYAGR